MNEEENKMGLNIGEMIKPIIRPIVMENLFGKTIAIDAFNVIIKKGH